ncbi:MAG: outer membrane beta-barrel family protein, partial [Daejeonella sp.]
IETGLKGISRNITSDYDIQNQTAGVFETNPLRSNVFDYSQDVFSAYGVLGAALKNSWSIKVGGRVELTDIEGSSQNVNAGLQPISQNYTSFVPSFILSKGFKNFQTVKLSYTKRIQRPSLQFLNPFRNISSVYSQSVGNPELSPEIAQTLELGYSTFVKTTVINASIYYKRTDNIIESFSTPIEYTYTDDSGQQKTVTANLTSFANIGENNSIGASLFGSVNPIKILTLRGNINAYTYGVSPGNQFNGNASQSNNKTYLLYNAFLSGSVKLKGGISAETFFILNAPRRTFQGENPAFNMWVLGVKKEILKKKGSIGFNMIDPFNERKNFRTNINNGTLVQSSNFALPFRSFGVNFSWNFGKLNFNAQPKKKRGVNNDDLKQGDGGQGQGGTGGN